MVGFNRTRFVDELLRKTDSLPPSFTVHLHLEHWFLNNSPKFLYNQPIASLLDDIRACRIPVDFLDLFDEAKVPFYDGCMCVEILDYRPQRAKEPPLEKPERTRVVLQPSAESLWADICLIHQKHGCKFADKDVLDLESQILVATVPPLCLEPDLQLTRVVNNVIRATNTGPPTSLKRKASAIDPEEDDIEKARRARIMQIWNPRAHRPTRTAPTNFSILGAIERMKNKQVLPQAKPSTFNGPVQAQQAVPPAQLQQQVAQPTPPKAPPTPAPVTAPTAQTGSPIVATADDPKKTQKPKPKPQPTAPPYTVSNPAPAPAPVQATTQFQVHQHPGSQQQPINAQTNMQTHVYNNVQNGGDITKRVASPAQYPHMPVAPSSMTQPTPQHQQPPQATLPAFQAKPSPAHYPTPLPPSRDNPARPQNVNTATPQPLQLATAAQSNPHAGQIQMHYYPHLMQQVQPQQIAATQSTGRSTPQTPAHVRNSPITTNQAPPQPRRGSPMVANLTIASRSPMPVTAQPAPQLSHPGQPLNYPPAANQYSNLRMVHTMPPSNAQSTPIMPSSNPQAALSAAQQPPNQDQSHIQQSSYTHMYRYPLNYAIPGSMPGYWPMGIGRGMVPGVVGNQHIPGVTNGAQPNQTPLGLGKTPQR